MPSVLERSWVGQRVSVRRAVRHPDGEGVAFADVVGDLVALDADHAIVETRSELVEIPVTHVAVARLVAPSTRDELDLQAVIARGWVAADQELLDGWTLRANGGLTGRANSVLAAGQLRRPLDEALDAVVAWYAARGLPPKFQLAVEARRLLDAELGERGWEPSENVHVMTRRLGPAGADTAGDDAAGDDAAGDDVTVRPVPGADWFEVYRAGAGGSEHARELLLRHPAVGFAELRQGGELVAIGRGTVDDRWLGITAVEVVPGARRRGHATAVMHALYEWGAAHGAVRAHLEVSASNTAALGLYGALGLRVHHDYRYRTAPGS
jgi:ribosomal protein S18 acetylase RimI-like enzyme